MLHRCDISSLVLEKPRLEINDNDNISNEDVKLFEELAVDFKKSYSLIYKRGKMLFYGYTSNNNKRCFFTCFCNRTICKYDYK